VDNPLTLNRYVYTANNPLRYIDSSGNEYTEIGDNNGTNRGSNPNYDSPIKFPESIEQGKALVNIYEKYGIDAIPKEYRDYVQIATGSMIPGVGLATVARAKAAPILRQNMVNAGIKEPNFKNAAHHIVAWGDKRAAEARKVLEKFNIDINDAANGIFLPIQKGVDDAIQHAKIHTNKYYQEIEKMLNQATTKEEVIETLEDIREQISQGIFPH